jgi:hypothetical protein
MSAVVSTPRPSSIRGAALLDRLVSSVHRHEYRYLLFTFFIFALLLVYSAATVPLSFDEFFTFSISRIASLSEMFRAMPADSQPPLQYLLTHFLLRWLPPVELSIRLPEMLAYLASSLLTWRIVRVHASPVQALFALALMMGASSGRILLCGFSVFNLSFTARPYQLVLAFTALAFLCWQTATLRERNRLLPLCGLSLSIAGAVLSHHYGVLQIGAFLAAGEFTRFLRRRRLDIRLLAATAAGLLPLVITVPMALETRKVLDGAILHSTHFFAKPSLIDLVTWPAMVPWLLFLPATILACLPQRTGGTGSCLDLPHVPRHELAAAVALALSIPLQIFMAAVATGYFLPRYAIDSTLGLALLCAWAWPRRGRFLTGAQRPLALLLIFFLLVATGDLLWAELLNPASHRQIVKAAEPSVLLNAPGDLPIVASNAFEYVPQWWYAPPALQRRLIFVSDLDYALQRPAFLAELSMSVDRAWLPFPVAQYQRYLADHPHFLLLCTGNARDVWMLPRLRQSGWHLNLISQSGSNYLYDAEQP